MASKSVKILTVYLSPSRPLITLDSFEFLDGRLPVLLAGDLNAKHVDRNFTLVTT